MVYSQREGVKMGLPLGPMFANAFMAHYEEIWIKECPKEFKSIFYKRYMDDCFVIFKNRDEAKNFHILSSKHENISNDYENEKSLPFLDIFIEKKFVTFVYRKFN